MAIFILCINGENYNEKTMLAQTVVNTKQEALFKFTTNAHLIPHPFFDPHFILNERLEGANFKNPSSPKEQEYCNFVLKYGYNSKSCEWDINSIPKDIIPQNLLEYLCAQELLKTLSAGRPFMSIELLDNVKEV